MNFKHLVLVFGGLILGLIVVLSWGCQQNQPTAPETSENLNTASSKTRATSYSLRARSTDGAGHVNLRINNQTVTSFTLGSSMGDYTASSSLEGDIIVQFDNDASDRDVQIDYLSVDGDYRQAENMSYNTGVWQDGSCGGSNSEWLHCNGSISFGNTPSGSGSTTTTSGGGGGSNVSYTLRARSTDGQGQVNLRTDNNTIATWTLGSSMSNYTASSYNTGDISVEFFNDATDRDVQIDYLEVNGDRRQAEDMPYNSAVWEDGSCGGDYSEWMHCNGVIGFYSTGGGGGSTTTTAAATTTSGGGGGSNTIVVRARGTGGGEHIYVSVGGSQIGNFNLTTSYQNYSASTNNTGGINVCFDNDDGENMDVQIDYITVNGSTRQAEDQSSNTGVWQDGSCGGSNSEWLHCEGCIGFGDVSGGGGSTTTTTITSTTTTTSGGGSTYVAYLLAYFRNENEKLHYAISTDLEARSFTALNGGNPVMQQFVRDPYIHRLQNGNFAFVHTTGMEGKSIGVWRSSDLINWTGGSVGIMDNTDTDKCWAPEFIWCNEENRYYVFWASRTSASSYNRIWHATTTDFTNLSSPSLWYDIGDWDIDLSIIRYNNEYLGFHKVGLLEDYNRLSRTSRLSQGFDRGIEVFTDGSLPTEGPETFQLIGQNKWYVIVDPFDSAMEVWETTNFSSFRRIQVSFPSGAKHCSVIQITQSELDALRARY